MTHHAPVFTCAGPGCNEPLPPYRGSGRPPEYCSDCCRAAAWRLKKHHQLAIAVADLIQISDERPLLAALAALDDPALQTLRATLSVRSQATTDGQSFATGVTIGPRG